MLTSVSGTALRPRYSLVVDEDVKKADKEMESKQEVLSRITG